MNFWHGVEADTASREKFFFISFVMKETDEDEHGRNGWRVSTWGSLCVCVVLLQSRRVHVDGGEPRDS